MCDCVTIHNMCESVVCICVCVWVCFFCSSLCVCVLCQVLLVLMCSVLKLFVSDQSDKTVVRHTSLFTSGYLLGMIKLPLALINQLFLCIKKLIALRSYCPKWFSVVSEKWRRVHVGSDIFCVGFLFESLLLNENCGVRMNSSSEQVIMLHRLDITETTRPFSSQATSPATSLFGIDNSGVLPTLQKNYQI